jgi:putative Holliday junction resolvase
MDIILKKKLAGIDYGQKRLGIAVCDSLHITVTPFAVLDPSDEKFWLKLLRLVSEERIEGFVIGIPYRDDDTNDAFISEIKQFIIDLKSKCTLPVYEMDEYLSTRSAVKTMISIGYSKKKRAKKGNKDKIAAAIILREYLNTIQENN